MRTTIYIILAIVLSSCASTRALKHGNPTLDDYKIFEQDRVANSERHFTFKELSTNTRFLDTLKLDMYFANSNSFHQMTIGESMEYIGKPSAAIIIKNDTILYEHYHGGWNKESQSTVFSITKTITSLLCGVALKEGCIRSVTDKVTDYIPELKKEDSMFEKLTIEHLLDMTAGLKFDESYNWNPFSQMAKLHYGKNTLKTIRNMKFANTPGERYHYNSMTTAILGIVIERATGIPYAEYLSEKVWKPLGMEQSASISLDSKKHRIAKSYGGLTTNVRDLAKIGRLYLNKGNWNGVQIIDTAFVERSHTKKYIGSNNGTYSYNWYWGTTDHRYFKDKESLRQYYKAFPSMKIATTMRSNKTGDYAAIFHRGGFWAEGLYGQVLYVNTEKNYIAVFLGADRIEDYCYVFDRLYEIL